MSDINNLTPSDEQVQKGLMALLQCSASDLGGYSQNLMTSYENDVKRVYVAMSSALIQRKETLEARVKELEKLKTTHKAVEDWEKYAYSEPEDEQDQNLCDALRDIRASVDVTEAALKRVLVAVQEYFPPDGITKDELISRVIACVDPWPSDGIHKLKDQL